MRAYGVVAAGEPETLLDGISAVAGYHNGGDLVFAPDGTLFVALGETHEPDRAQDEDDIGGKMVRLTAQGGVPADNPFGAGNPVWSIGHRNSFGLCIDRQTGARSAGDPEQFASFPAGVTDVAHGPSGALFVATANAIWTIGPLLEQADERSPWRA